MLTYKVTISSFSSVSTSKLFFYIYQIIKQIIAEKTNSIFLTLVNSNNESSKKVLVNKSYFGGFWGFEKLSFDICVEKDFGDIIQVKLEKKKHLVNFQWFCGDIKVKTPSGKCFEFPYQRCIEHTKEAIIHEGTARLPQDDTELLRENRRRELESRQKRFRWKWSAGFPFSLENLLLEVQFDAAKIIDFNFNFLKAIVGTVVDKIKGCFQSWKDISDLKKILDGFDIKNTLLENVMQDWSEDYMFGYQFLNGCNPVMIKKCTEIPDKFPVTHEMVKGFLKKGVTLQEELKAGNIYIVDYEKLLSGLVSTPKSEHYLTAPLCLLYKNRLDQIVPIAIQLSQTPGEKSPIFLPSDNEYDWMLAKMWVKSADFIVHQLVTHLLKTHLISEVFEMATYRQLSKVHPVYKLLKPHVRFTTAINAAAREKLINENGVISQINSLTTSGTNEVIKRAMDTLTYESLCFPETIEDRGMKDVPKYYYRDDGMRIWEVIHSFVSAVVEIYYDSDEAVQEDVEIQGFVKDCRTGMNNLHKFPESLKTREELVKYLTIVIFNASAQHAAVNFGQYEWYGWIPNSPSTMRKPPPEQKGTVDMQFIMDSLPDRKCSSLVLGTTWALSQFQMDELYLGMYSVTRFTEQPVKEAIKTFRKNLEEVTNTIKSRNKGLAFDYGYLSPDKIPNSVAI